MQIIEHIGNGDVMLLEHLLHVQRIEQLQFILANEHIMNQVAVLDQVMFEVVDIMDDVDY